MEMIGWKVLWALAFLLIVGTSFGQRVQIPYGLRGISTLQSQGNVLGVISPAPGLQQQQQEQPGGIFDTDAGSQNPFINVARFPTGINLLPDRTFRDIFGEDGRQADGEFPGTMSSDFLGTQQGSLFARGSTGSVSPAGVLPPQFGGNARLAGRLRDQFDGSSGLSTPGRLIQAQFGGDAGLSVNFAGLASPNVVNQNQFGAFQFGGDAHVTGSAFQPLSQSFAGSSRVEARPDVTLTRTITVDRFVTTTNTAFIGESRTATIFSIVTQTAVTTVVVPTPVDRSVIVSTALATGAPVIVTVTDVMSEFQYVTRTEVQYVTLTHTSRRFTQETLRTTDTIVQTVPTTVVRTNINTVTTTFTDVRTVTSTVFSGYYQT